LPVLVYSYGKPEYVQHISQLAQIVAQTKDAEDAQFQDILEQERVAYIYIGAKGGPLTPQMFLGHSHYRPVYDSGAVWIFEVVR
jgi:hypothetical protein